MDATDLKILNLLQANAKLTTKELSKLLFLSNTAIFERIKKLEKSKIIDKYVAILDKKKINRNFIVLCHIKLTHHTKNSIKKFEEDIQQLSEVSECYHVSGDYDYIVKVCLENMDAYRLFLVSKLTSLENIGSTHSTFVMGEIKNSFSIEM
jgi:Lrp/AsnC family transcriptional regulator, leucine-responsive regulatory protein